MVSSKTITLNSNYKLLISNMPCRLPLTTLWPGRWAVTLVMIYSFNWGDNSVLQQSLTINFLFLSLSLYLFLSMCPLHIHLISHLQPFNSLYITFNIPFRIIIIYLIICQLVVILSLINNIFIVMTLMILQCWYLFVLNSLFILGDMLLSNSLCLAWLGR